MPIGIVTDRDLIVQVVATELDFSVITVGDILIGKLVVIKESAGVCSYPINGQQGRKASACCGG